MSPPQFDLLQGTLDVLILKALRASGTSRDGDLPQNFADNEWSLRREGGFSLSSSSSHGRGRVAYLHVGRIGDESACEVLFVDKSWQKAASKRDRAVGTDLPRNGNSPGNQLGGHCDQSISCTLGKPVP